MSQKYDILPMASKYDITPQRFLFRPSSSTSPNTNIPFTTPPTYIPMASTTKAPPASTTTTLHHVPSPSRHSTDSDADSIASTSARLIYPSSHHIAQTNYPITLYPTTVLRLTAAILLIISMSLFAAGIPQHAIPALIFIPLALLRILAVFLSHTPRDAHWRGRRGANLVLDFAVVASIAGSAAGAFVRNKQAYWGGMQSVVAACILSWIACGFIALAAVDTGRPTRIACTSKLSLDFWTGEGALSLDNWDAERPEMGRSASLLG